ncbi:MAG: hypothetical protein GDA44_14325 [Prochloron sp. SP5CPC1]|nr:hypothetical protein [Candidatus Paraprochloron terpiosi SP5CPC1]
MNKQQKLSEGLKERANQRDEKLSGLKKWFNNMITSVEKDFWFIREDIRRPIVIVSLIALIVIPYGLTVALAIKGFKDKANG